MELMVDENNESIGYEGMRSFAIVKGNLTSDDLGYWLNQKELYAPGLMKAAYGTFLTPLLVIYENDRVADESASKFNVTWSRISPVCVSLCNDYNCIYITGDSNHIMGREAVGNASGVWKFNFATSFSFSLIEQLVGNNVWNTTKIGSVTLGLIESYMNNKTLELFSSNGYIFIKHTSDNNTLLFLDLKTGIVRDCFNYYGLLGTMPCYHDNITENAWKYGNNLLNNNVAYSNFLNISIFSIGTGVFMGLLSSESIIAGETLGLVVGSSIAGPLAIILIPVIFELLRPELANLFESYGLLDLAEYYRTNNTLDMAFDALYYFIFGDANNIPIEQRSFLFMLLSSSFLTHPEFISFALSNQNSDLRKLINLALSFSKKNQDLSIKLDINEVNHIIKNAPSSGPILPLGELGKKLRESFHQLKKSIKNRDIKGVMTNSIVLAFGGFCVGALVTNFLGKQISQKFKQTFEKIINESIP